MMKIVYSSCMLALALIAFMPRGGGGSTGAQDVHGVVTGSDASEETPEMAGNGVAEVVLKRADDGHYYARAEINGVELRFLVDSGASVVALSRSDAARVGIHIADGDFTDAASTAAGVVQMKRVTLDRVSIGPVAATRVEAAVLPGEGGLSLLGQSFLTRVREVKIANGEMRLR